MVNGVQNQVNTLINSPQGGNDMGRDDFLKLMIAQLQNQDPLSPMDGTEYAAQLAQFTSLEQLTNLNDSVNRSIDANYYLTQSINNTLTATLIGNNVKLASSSLQNIGQDDISFGYNLGADAANVTVEIFNEDGALVSTITEQNISSGDHQLSWDFTDNNGNKLPEGNYTFEVTATNANGDSLDATTFGTGTIDGIKFSENGTTLIVGGIEYQLADVLEILRPTPSTDSEGGG
ncbi:MAG: flagellar hook capping protein [Melioribacteraceae bacterium]|nr:flagellar hook capping protein [Melioribacteraceae bacterium]